MHIYIFLYNPIEPSLLSKATGTARRGRARAGAGCRSGKAEESQGVKGVSLGFWVWGVGYFGFGGLGVGDSGFGDLRVWGLELAVC